MQFRNSSPEATSSKDWQYTDFGLPDSSSRRCLSVASTIAPTSPVQSSRSLLSSSPSLAAGASSRHRSMSSSRSHGNTSNKSCTRKRGIHEEIPKSSGKHGFRFGPRGSTGLPWSSAPFYNDRNHPFLGHYYDRDGEKAAHRRGKQVLSSFENRFVPEFTVLG